MHFAGGIIVGEVRRVAAQRSEVEKAAVVGREGIRPQQATLLTAELTEEGDIHEQVFLICTDASLRVRLRQYRQMAALCRRVTDGKRGPARILRLAFDEP